MQVIYAEEQLADCLEDAKPLLLAQWEELARNKDLVPLSPDYPALLRAEETEQYFACTARRDERLIGYATWFVCPPANYTTTMFAESHVFWIDPAERLPRVALRLFEFTEARLKARGVVVAHWRTKIAHPAAARLLAFMNYAPIETVFAKVL